MNGPIGQLVGDVGDKDTSESFTFVVARQYDITLPITYPRNMCIYAYCGEIQRGNITEARYFLDYVNRQYSYDKDEEYRILIVKFEELE